MKKFASLLLVLVLVLTMAAPVFADETGELADPTFTLTINQAENDHIYDVYQIFSGDLLDGTTDDDPSTTGIILSNIEWGSSVADPEGLVEALLADTHTISYQSGGTTVTTNLANVFSAVAGKANTADAVANILGSGLATAVVDRFAEVVGTVNYDEDGNFDSHEFLGAAAGTADEDDHDNGVYTVDGLEAGYYMIKDRDGSQTGTDSFYTKYILQVLHSVEVTPKGSGVTVTKGINDTLDGNFGAVEDFDINDTVYYEWEGTLPTNLSSYDTYFYRFTDTLPNAMTFEQIEQIYIENADGNRIFTVMDVTDTSTDNDIPATAYNVTITTDGTVEEDGETYNQIVVEFEDLKTTYPNIASDNKVIVRYSCYLNRHAVPGEAMVNDVYLEYDNNPDGEGIGHTVDDYAHAFTFALTVDKFELNNEAKKLNGVEFLLYYTRTETNQETGKPTTTYYYAKLITEEMVEAGERVNDIPVTEEDVGVVYGWTTNREEASVLDTDENGALTVRGLDAGKYYLEEIKTNEGYNLLESAVEINISASYSNTDTEEATVSVEYSVDGTSQGTSDTVKIANSKGNTLPSTGGIGTTLFYVIGGILGAAVVVILVTKRRMVEE